MFSRTGLRAAALLATGAALSGIAYAAVGPNIGAPPTVALQASSTSVRADAASLQSQIQQGVLKFLTAAQGKNVISKDLINALAAQRNQSAVSQAMINTLKAQRNQGAMSQVILKDINAPQNQSAMSQVILKDISAPRNQGAMSQEIIKEITAPPNQTAISNEIINTFKAQQNQSQVQGVMVSQLMRPPAEQALMTIAKQQGLITQTQANANYVQGQDKIFSGQATSTSAAEVTVLTVPGVLHVTAQWEYSDGTAFFHVYNDSGGTLDFGGDFNGFPVTDSFGIPNPGTGMQTTQFGQLSNLSAADGTIAPGAHEDFQIAPEAGTTDQNETVPYRGEAHIQVTAPGHELATLDLSAYVVPASPYPITALLSGQAVVGAL